MLRLLLLPACTGPADSGLEVPVIDSAVLDSQPPVGWVSVEAAGSTTCGRRTSGEVVCWGQYSQPGISDAVDYTVSGAVCWTDASGTGRCNWGADDWVADRPVVRLMLGPGACLLAETGSITCPTAEAAPPTKRFSTFDVWESGACGIDEDGYVACWAPYMPEPPSQKLTQIDLGRLDGCGLDEAGSIVCWGFTEGDLTSYLLDSNGEFAVPRGTFVKVEHGDHSACALEASGQVTCWGANNKGEADVPDNVLFQDIGMGECHGCGVTVDGEMVCWGMDDAIVETIPCGRGDQHIPPQ